MSTEVGYTRVSEPIQETCNPARAAKQVGIPVSTLRLWTRQYGEFLSAGANPTPGDERRYTAADIEIMRNVNQLRHNGMLPADITQRLRNNAVMPSTPATNAPDDVADVPHVQTAIAPAADALQAFLARSDSIRDNLVDMDRRVAALEHRNTTVLIAVAAFAAGVLLVLVVVVLVLQLLR